MKLNFICNMILRCHILITYCQVAESICYYLANSYVILSSSYHDIEMRDEEEEEDADYEEEDEKTIALMKRKKKMSMKRMNKSILMGNKELTWAHFLS